MGDQVAKLPSKKEGAAMDKKDLLDEVSKEEMMSTIQWMYNNTPYRLAGSEDEARASEYVTERMREYGLEVTNEEFYTYNSNPLYSNVEVLSPVKMKIDSLPCAHIRATKEEGEIFDLVYVGTGSYNSYKGLDVKGKMVLVEVSYAPPVPEKGRIAYEMGAAGIICMNWGNDEEVICHRGLKAVWGNPTEDNFKNIPDIVGVGITRNAGLKLKELYLSDKNIKVKVTAIADRKWSKVHQPKGILRGNGNSDEFLLVCSHLDAWKPGVTCNATGNATTLEICRLFARYRQYLDRDIYFVFWDGHEIAEAAGSTWFVDNYWDLINKKCVAYMHIDSTGVGQTKIYEIKASDELLKFAKDNFNSIMDKDIRAMSLKKIGDQSFMGIGVPSITQRMSFTQEDMDKAHGATLGWWNHTKEDGLDKCDPDILVEDTKVSLSVLYQLATEKFLPYDFNIKFEKVQKNVNELSVKYSQFMDFSDLIENLKVAAANVNQIQSNKNSYPALKVRQYNQFVMSVCRLTTNIFQTYTDKYDQDSYGYTKLSSSIPLFSDLDRLSKLNEDSLEYGLIKTKLIKNKNRINDALNYLINLSELYQIVLAR